jgi:hypothetical protein
MVGAPGEHVVGLGEEEGEAGARGEREDLVGAAWEVREADFLWREDDVVVAEAKGTVFVSTPTPETAVFCNEHGVFRLAGVREPQVHVSWAREIKITCVLPPKKFATTQKFLKKLRLKTSVKWLGTGARGT